MFLSTTIYFVTWYFVAFPIGLMTDASHAGGMWVSLILFHTFTLLMGFAIASLAQNKQASPPFISHQTRRFELTFSLSPSLQQQAALVIPMFLAIFSSFSGVLVPFSMIPTFWRQWFVRRRRREKEDDCREGTKKS